MDIEKFTDEYFQYKLDTQTFDSEDMWEFIKLFKIKITYKNTLPFANIAIIYCKFYNSYYACEWDCGSINNLYKIQPYKVIPVEYYKTILVKEWKKV
jgi:hypothetical protein